MTLINPNATDPWALSNFYDGPIPRQHLKPSLPRTLEQCRELLVELACDCDEARSDPDASPALVPTLQRSMDAVRCEIARLEILRGDGT